MLNNELIQLIRAKISGFLESSKSLDVVSHNGQKGRFREIVLSELIKPFLPSSCTCLHGATIGAGTGEGGRFEQLEDDILIVDRDLVPHFLIGKENAVVPKESVLARIEVKSKLTKAEMEKAVKNAKRYRKLKFAGTKKEYPDAETIQLLFIFKASKPKSGGSQLTRFKEIHPEAGIPPIQSICSSGEGLWFYGSPNDCPSNWLTIKQETLNEERHNEIIAFLGLLMNSIQRTKNIRKFGKDVEDSLDRLGSYLFKLEDFESA